jgi:hypothetical protein
MTRTCATHLRHANATDSRWEALMWRLIPISGGTMGRRVGRRGLLLLLGGLAWILVGVGLLNQPVERFSAPGYQADSLLQWFDRAWVGWVWIAAGVIALVTGGTRNRALVSRHDAVGFNAWLTPPLTWLALYVWSGGTYLFTRGADGNDNSAVGTVTWALICLVIIVVAGWPDPTDPASRHLVSAPPRPAGRR